MQDLIPLQIRSFPRASEAAHESNVHLSSCTANAPSVKTRLKDTASIVRYSDGPIIRKSTDSSGWSPLMSPIPSPLPAYASTLSLRTTLNSSPTLISPFSDNPVELLDIRLNLICNWLHQKQLQNQWTNGNSDEGVVLKKNKNEHVCCPVELSSYSNGLYEAVRLMNVKCAMTVNTRTTRMILDLSGTHHIPLDNGLHLQILPDFASLPTCQKNQSAAFILSPPILVVWNDNPAFVIDKVEELESQMMSIVWNGRIRSEKDTISFGGPLQPPDRTKHLEEAEIDHRNSRDIVLIQPLIVATTLVIMCLALGAGWRNIAIEIKVENSWLYLLFPLVGPLQAWLGLFFFQTLPTCFAQVCGPVHQMKQNSKFFSSKAPPRLCNHQLPHITIQCPVYKESLVLVIEPTILSIKTAIATYEMQGGTADIFINDDGMQVIADDQAAARREFYDEHNIGWVARPRHNFMATNSKKLFIRAGKFKKASNMNYALNFSARIEAKLEYVFREVEWTAEREEAAYNEALAEAIAEDRGCTMACGNVRIGDYILLVDCDTRVPQDCLLDAVNELQQSPEVAIIQFSSGVMNVTQSWFEKGITFFTHLVYTAIEFAVANGDVAPFVGHNAILRWSAIQDIAFTTPDDPTYLKFWSEDTVSEDFDMALRLQTSGYIIRLATYAKDGFKEGVSLTVYDELARWEKYAYGCSELIFNPLIQWITKGPFTPLFWRFTFSNMPLHSKLSIMAYVGTYFAIASSWILTVLNYFLIGWYSGYLDHYYMESFKIYFSVCIVFNVIGNIALAIFRYRINERNLLPALVENFKWVLLLTTFLGGMSLHISQAILCHLFSIDMTWGATSKEVTNTSFFGEIPIILRKFRVTFILCFLLTLIMIVLSGVGPLQDFMPHYWQITHFTAIVPLALMVASHALLPLALNPGLMQFTF